MNPPPASADENPWSAYRLLVIKELEDINKKLENIESKLNQHHTDIALLKLKAGAWGAITGLVGGAIAAIFSKWTAWH